LGRTWNKALNHLAKRGTKNKPNPRELRTQLPRNLGVNWEFKWNKNSLKWERIKNGIEWKKERRVLIWKVFQTTRQATYSMKIKISKWRYI